MKRHVIHVYPRSEDQKKQIEKNADWQRSQFIPFTVGFEHP